jgi:outer membrane lipoprotein carrier protein
MRKFMALVGLACCLAVGATRADEQATAALIDRLADIDQLAGSFNQVQFSTGGDEIVGESSGRFRLLRPGYFAWEIEAPDNQLIIADPQHVWHYDRDLETVTRRPVEGNEALSPLQVLGGNSQVLRERFTISQSAQGDFLLRPLGDNAGFRSLLLRLDQGGLAGMEILDNLDQRLVITFADVRSDAGLSAADFAFTPPEGVDLFYHDR